MLVRDVIAATARVSGLSVDQLVAPSWTKHTVRVRQVGILVSSRVSQASLPAIGRRWGDRDHTTVLHSTARALEHLAAGDETATATLADLLLALGLSELPAGRPQGAPVRGSGRATLEARIATLEAALALARAQLAALDGAPR